MDKDRTEPPPPRPEFEFAHEGYCNADRNKAVGCEGCSCRAGREIKKLRAQAAEMAQVIRDLTPLDQMPVRKAVTFETAEFIYSTQQ